jgi:hypothetical protein
MSNAFSFANLPFLHFCAGSRESKSTGRIERGQTARAAGINKHAEAHDAIRCLVQVESYPPVFDAPSPPGNYRVDYDKESLDIPSQ